MIPLLLFIRAVALAPHFEGERDPAQLEQMLDEISALGADHLSLIVQWAQADIYSAEIAPYPWGTDDVEIRRLIRSAKKRGLKVLLFPILKVEKEGPGEWRGRLAPKDPEAWWYAYRAFILHYAELGAQEGVGLLSVGSELGSMESARDRWLSLIRAVRARFSGQLLYSANWDHYTQVSFWSALDIAGVSAYFPLSSALEPSLEDLKRSWSLIRDGLRLWAKFVGKPLIFTELGYRSLKGTAQRPYHYSSGAQRDDQAQFQAWRAFVEVWQREPTLSGLVLWIWSRDGPTGYCPKGRPAEELIRDFFKQAQAETPTHR